MRRLIGIRDCFNNFIFKVSGEGGGVKLYANSLDCAKTILRTEGMIGFYNGLSASMARQLSYTTVRLGIYNILLDKFTEKGFYKFILRISKNLVLFVFENLK